MRCVLAVLFGSAYTCNNAQAQIDHLATLPSTLPAALSESLEEEAGTGIHADGSGQLPRDREAAQQVPAGPLLNCPFHPGHIDGQNRVPYDSNTTMPRCETWCGKHANNWPIEFAWSPDACTTYSNCQNDISVPISIETPTAAHVPQPTAPPTPACATIGRSKRCREAGCAWARSGNARFKSCVGSGPGPTAAVGEAEGSGGSGESKITQDVGTTDVNYNGSSTKGGTKGGKRDAKGTTGNSVHKMKAQTENVSAAINSDAVLTS